MTRQQFELFRLAVASERFVPETTGPFSIGLERGEFEKQKLERLIAAARTCSALTVKRRLEIYARQLKRLGAAQRRLERLRADLQAPKDTALDRRPELHRRNTCVVF